MQVMVDEVDDEGVIARSKADAPEIDGLVLVDSDKQYEPGSFINVKITDASEHDLFAVETE
jgi:ribosomal protein S12 methylthiotransferase